MKAEDLHHNPLKILVIITDRSRDQKISGILKELKIGPYYHINGKGTAGSELLEICGLDSRTRSVNFCVIWDILTPSVFAALKKYADFNKKGTGIAFTMPINGAQAHLLAQADDETAAKIHEKLERSGEDMKSSAAYSMIVAACNQGYSGSVMEAAKAAGASGGTIIKGRREGAEHALRFLGIATGEEREVVIIIAAKENKGNIMREISRSCGISSEAHGIILSLPVDEIIGLAGQSISKNL